MKHLSNYAAYLQIAEQVKRKATPTWSALKEPGRYVRSELDSQAKFAARMHERMEQANWPVPKGIRHA